MSPKDNNTVDPSTSQVQHEEKDQEHQLNEKSHSKVLLCAPFSLLFLIVLIALAVLLILLLVGPNRLLYTVEESYVHGYTLAADKSTVTATFNITMSAYNHNHKLSISYDWARMSVECKKQVLAYTDLEPFVQSPMNTSVLRVLLQARNVTLQECTASDLISKPSGYIKVHVLVRADIRFEAENWVEDGRMIRVICHDVKSHFPDSKAFQTTGCDVEI